MAASGVRHGLTGQVQNKMLKFNSDNEIEFDFKGKDLVKGETDGSSYPNGGLRGTHCAGGYLAIDTSSPIFMRGDTMFIPSAFVSYYGAALDEDDRNFEETLASKVFHYIRLKRYLREELPSGRQGERSDAAPPGRRRAYGDGEWRFPHVISSESRGAWHERRALPILSLATSILREPRDAWHEARD